MSSKRLYYILLGSIIVLVVGLIGGAYGTDKLLASRSKTLEHSRLQAAVLSQQQDQLLVAKNDIRKYQSLYTITQSVVPQDKDQAQTVREIVAIAGKSGIELSAITFPASTLGGTGTNGPTTTTPAAGSTKQNALSQLTPVKNIPGVYDLPITVQSNASVTVPYANLLDFLDKLEQNRRTALVSSVTINPDTTHPGNVSFTLTLDEYIKP